MNPDPRDPPTRDVSDSRKTAYYVGRGLALVGLLLFLSVFVTAAMDFGEFDRFEDRARSSMLRAIAGMALMILGGVLSHVGARGMAGSGMVLDPRRARRDLEPYSRLGGGMVGDALDEAGLGGGGRDAPEKVVMIKCRACGQLNEEDSKFCQECGEPL